MTSLHPIPDHRNRRTPAPVDGHGDDTVVRLRTHRRGTMAEPEGGIRSEGTSALAAPFAMPAPRHLHAVGSADEQRWVARLAARITGAAIEVLAGVRPVHQLAHVAHRDILAALQLRANLSRADAPGASPELALVHRGAAILSSQASMVRPGVYEASAVVSDRLRCRAVAMRLEQIRGAGWRVTALEIG
ncbi:Rv3235 family protein [Sinomonas sp. JGH33]|uniref:Rv3235 family protein n=1 Tax=Sinomonas terricola TaxID=3110330 RepID=A0ABU5T0D2_9MICC|nr:Rv3235 family protein [Sinomonas sp. JGH33]MEA5453108.1 Rv3235 family protein [Sinomonas sp. JGH33]